MATSANVVDKHICHACIGEGFLASDVKATGSPAACEYCAATNSCISIDALADRIGSAFDSHYQRTADQPDSWQQTLLADRESSYVWERNGERVVDAIENAAQIPAKAAQDVLDILAERHDDFDAAAMGQETEFSPDSYYEEKGTDSQAWQEEWHQFEMSLKTEARFFSRSAAEHLSSVFGDIHKLKTTSGRPLLVEAGPELSIDHLFRARVFQKDDQLREALCRPDKHLGSPPSALASAGRMNARGISVFYGATEAPVAIAEVRPPVGSSVAVARFSIIRKLRLLDLTALDDVHDGGSIFDTLLKDRLERAAFLQTLGRRMTRPVMPDDEVFDYLATQAVADFLSTQNEPRFDGIIFRSAQSETGRNVVLFHKAALVATLELPEGTKLNVDTLYNTDDGFDRSYAVVETVPAPASASGKPKQAFPFATFVGSATPFDREYRDPALTVDPESIVVQRVDWVQYQSSPFPVTRHRFVDRSWNFEKRMRGPHGEDPADPSQHPDL